MRFADRLKALFGITNPDREAFFDDLADLLVEGDLGAGLAFQVADELRAACRKGGITGPEAIRRELKRILAAYCRSASIEPVKGSLNVFLLLGVNGVGKTTSCAKLAHYYAERGLVKDVVLAAGDTFRAAAIDQLRIHGERLGRRVVAQEQGSDPGAVLYDAIESAKAQGADLVIADTAGRMHTRQDLIRELAKIDKIVATRAAGANYRRLLVLDATTGQNGMRQAESFKEAVPIDGVILTKVDSSAKGGLAIALSKEMGIPIAFLGRGEGYGDLAAFDADSFLDEFLGLGAFAAR
jgi:fused signal recognition particle receptor